MGLAKLKMEEPSGITNSHSDWENHLIVGHTVHILTQIQYFTINLENHLEICGKL